jgi:hypothetical protein
MTIQRFSVDTVKRAAPLIEFRKNIVFKGMNDSIQKGLNDLTIDIHEIETPEGKNLPIREYCSVIDLELEPEWVKQESKDVLSSLIFEDEALEDTVELNVYLLCVSTKEIIDLKKFNIRDINGQNNLIFKDIDLSLYSEKIEIHSSLVRNQGRNSDGSMLADRKKSILCENKIIQIYIDEVDAPGGNHLDIRGENLGGLLFNLKNWNSEPLSHPAFLYNDEFDKYIKGGDHYDSVQLFLMMSLVMYADNILKWVFFSKSFNESDDYHGAMLDFLLQILNVKRSDLIDILDSDDTHTKMESYLNYSNTLIEKIQISNISYKSMFEKFISSELKSN